jgi:branched-chain amino acid transport system substrate-binding protein
MKPGKIRIFLTVFALIVIVSPVFGQTTKTAAPSGAPIKIGGSLPLTGLASEQAKWISAGYEFWAEDINRRGGLLGRPVKLTIYDDESSAEKAVTYYERAITVDKVDLVSGGYPGTSNVALMPLVEKYKMVFVGMGGHMESFQQGYTYSFASPPMMSNWAYLCVGGIFNDLIPKAQWPKSVALFTMNNVIGLSARGPLLKWFQQNNVPVVVNETYNLPLGSAAPLISKAKAKGAEAMLCMSLFDDGVMLTQAAKATNYNPKLIWHQLASTIPAWMKEMGPGGNNVTADGWWNSHLPFPGNDVINAGAKARFNLPETPSWFGLGYCWVKTLELAVQGAGTLDNTKIRDYLRSHTFDLPYMKGVVFDKAGLPQPYGYVVQTTNGRLELIWPKSVATVKLVYPRPPWGK